MNYLKSIQTRRSILAKNLVEPGPSKEQIEQIITIAARVPDHGKLAPWHFTVIDKAAQDRLIPKLQTAYAQNYPESTSERQLEEASKIARAPICILLTHTPKESKIPEWEQELSCGAAAMNILHAAHALGFGAQWLTPWMTYSPACREVFDLGKGDKIAGFFYIGTAAEPPKERTRPDLEDIVSWL